MSANHARTSHPDEEVIINGLREVAEKLPEDERMVFIAYDIEGEDFPQIALGMGAEEHQVIRTRRRALKHLKQIMS